MTSAYQIAEQAFKASKKLIGVDADHRNKALQKIASGLISHQEDILIENKKDLDFAEKENYSPALIDRLKLDTASIKSISESVLAIKDQPEVLGFEKDVYKRQDGLEIKKQRIPIGVIAIIFESRPNVVIDCAALAIKSGNAAILKGGKEAFHSNQILGKIVSEAIADNLPPNTVQVIESTDRKTTQELMQLDQYIDLLVPRGGEGLIRYVKANSKIPVIAHDRGLCHLYVDASADLTKALKITRNAKSQRTGVCNALETLLVHQGVAKKFLPEFKNLMSEDQIELRGCDQTLKILNDKNVIAASDEDWNIEYLDRILSIKVVESSEAAISHIQQYGSQHTEAIVSDDQEAQEKFLNSLDASCIAVNASTRFNDGGELGLGAEIGISTTKMHAYGPMGAKGLTIERFVIFGDGHIR